MFTKKNRRQQNVSGQVVRDGKRFNNNNNNDGGSRKIVGDARMQIIIQQRSKIKDARDRLNLIAKKTDAREKLLNMKMNNGGRVTKFGGKQHVTHRLGNNSNGARVLQARTMVQIQRQLMENQLSDRTERNPKFTPAPRRQRNTNLQFPGEQKKVIMKNNGMLITMTNIDHNQFRSSLPMIQVRNNDDKFTSHEEEEDRDIEMTDVSSSVPFKQYIRSLTQRDPIEIQPRRNRLSANLQARLDLGGTNTQKGAIVLVSNLHPEVTEDDIVELFGDVGPLKRATLRSKGIAEVVYINAADAQRACDAYHNRQLDGKPMSVKLTQQSSSTTPSFASPSTSRVSPDAQLIRRALFGATSNAFGNDVSPATRFTTRVNRK